MVNWKSKYLKYKLKFEKLNQKAGMNLTDVLTDNISDPHLKELLKNNSPISSSERRYIETKIDMEYWKKLVKVAALPEEYKELLIRGVLASDLPSSMEGNGKVILEENYKITENEWNDLVQELNDFPMRNVVEPVVEPVLLPSDLKKGDKGTLFHNDDPRWLPLNGRKFVIDAITPTSLLINFGPSGSFEFLKTHPLLNYLNWDTAANTKSAVAIDIQSSLRAVAAKQKATPSPKFEQDDRVVIVGLNGETVIIRQFLDDRDRRYVVEYADGQRRIIRESKLRPSEDNIMNAFYNPRFNNYRDIMLMPDWELEENGYSFEDRMIALEMVKLQEKVRLEYLQLDSYISELKDLRTNVPGGGWLAVEYRARYIENILVIYHKAKNIFEKLDKYNAIFNYGTAFDYLHFFRKYFKQFPKLPTHLSDVEFDYVPFPAQMNLAGVDLSNMSFRNANLQSVNFTGADLNRSAFSEVMLVDCNFTNANLLSTYWEYAELQNCNFTNANLSHTKWYFAKVDSNILIGANLTGSTYPL